MKIILQEKVANLGKVGDEVNVKPGYGRNYLIPQSKAVLATKENIAAFELKRTELEKAAQDTLDAAKERAQKLEGLTVTITAEASEEGKLYGSVGPRDVAQAVTDAGVEVTKGEINLPEGPIRNVGEFTVSAKLHSEVDATIKVNVVSGAGVES